MGVLFLISGIGKSLAAFDFSQILAQYGFDFLQYFAPPIILFEIVLGLLLFFGYRIKLTSVVSIGFVLLLTLVYLYGFFIQDIAECGCFGYFSWLNMSPFFTFLRNCILMALLLFVFIKSKGIHKTIDKSEFIVITVILCAVCFSTGYTFLNNNENRTTRIFTEGEELNIDIDKTKLGEFVHLSKDSTYLVFVFSYACPFCYNSIENLKQYERLEVVDKVIGVAFNSKKKIKKNFTEIFLPNFTIMNFPPNKLFRLTNRFPISYIVKNNKVIMEIEGVLPCGVLLKQELEKRD